MIRVTVELIPFGVGKPRLLGIAEIANDCTGTLKSGNYDVKLSKWAPKEGQTWKKGRVEGFDRVKRGPWDLLLLALYSCVGSRNAACPPPEPTVCPCGPIGEYCGDCANGVGIVQGFHTTTAEGSGK